MQHSMHPYQSVITAITVLLGHTAGSGSPCPVGTLLHHTTAAIHQSGTSPAPLRHTLDKAQLLSLHGLHTLSLLPVCLWSDMLSNSNYLHGLRHADAAAFWIWK